MLTTPLTRIRFCKAEILHGLIHGTLCLPTGGSPRKLAFAICENLLLFVEDSNFVQTFIASLNTGSFKAAPTVGRVFCEFLEHCIQDDLLHIEELEGQASTLETLAESGRDGAFSGRMLTLRKKVSELGRYYAQQSNMAQLLLENEAGCFSEQDCRSLKRFSERVDRLRNEAQILREYLIQIRELYQAQISIRQNETMKFLTAITTVFLPLTLIAGWYGMNFKNMPELSWQYGYPAVIVLSILIGAVCVWIFKKKKFW